MFELLAFSIIGVWIGAATGLIPGVHPNTIIFVSVPIYLSSEMEFMSYAGLLIGCSVSHTFHNFVPSIYLRSPTLLRPTELSSRPEI